MKRSAAIGSVIAFSAPLLPGSVTHSKPASREPISLDRFIGNFPATCETRGSFEKFRTSIRNRYSYDDKKAPDLRRANDVAIPTELRFAFGKASFKYEGESTHVVIPLAGSYRGLKTYSLVFDFGDNNGVQVTSLAFDEPLAALGKELGPDVRRADGRLQASRGDAGIDMGFYAKIDAVLGHPAVRCNRST